MALSLTNAQELLLCKLSYLDFAINKDDFDANYNGKTLGQVAEYLLRDSNGIQRLEQLNLDGRLPGGLGEAQFRYALSAIAADPTLSNMTLTNFVNNNGDGNSGYVGYALSSADDNACIILSRGSESYPTNGSFLQDWVYTNFGGIGMTGQAQQFNDAVAFARASSGGYAETLAVGHSLGAGLSLYVAASVDGFVAHGYDGPGISQMLSIDQLVRLINSGSINYVANSDFVGPIRYIPGITQFVQTNPNAFYCGNEVVNDEWWSGHCLDAFNIVNNNVVPTTDRTVVSYISGIVLGNITQLLNAPFELVKLAVELIGMVYETTSYIVQSDIEGAGILVNKVLDTASSIINAAMEYGEAEINNGLETINDISDSVSKIVQSGIEEANNIINRVLDTTADVLDLISGKSNDVFNSGMNMLSRLSSEISSICQDINFDNIRNSISTLFTTAQKYILRNDPLTLDLDGDGIETIGIDSNNPILFDHDGDGIKTGTGWIKPDDGFLVLDRNGNGTIDNGTELFGDSTPLYAGGTAADGFAALRQEDTNNDGVVNSQDANWNNLKVWRDMNSDGISQSEELFKMEQAGIGSINVANIENSQTLPNTNQIDDIGTYNKTDGTINTVGTVVCQMADVNFAVDTFNREFTDTILVSTEVEQLPDMNGSGLCRDLHEAASLSTVLADVLNQYSQLTTRQEQQAMLDTLLDAWADTSGLAETMEDRDPDNYRIIYNRIGDACRLDNYVTGSIVSGGSVGGGVGVYVKDVENPLLTESYRQLIAGWNQKLHILESFNGRYFFTFPDQTQEGGSAVTGMTLGSESDVGCGYIGSGETFQYLVIDFYQPQITMLDEAYIDLRESVYQALFYQTRFQTEFAPLLDLISLDVGVDGQCTFNFTQLEQHFHDAIAANPAQGMSDLIEFNKYVAANYLPSEWKGNEIMIDYYHTLTASPELQVVYADLMTYVGQTTSYYTGSERNEIIVSRTAGGNVDGSLGNDVQIGSSNIDILDGGEGNDILDGGESNDVLSGGLGSDTYIHRIGSGNDTISNYASDYATTTDTVMFGPGITPFDLELVKVSTYDMRMNILGTTDSLLMSQWFNHDGNYNSEAYRVDKFVFDDGTVMTAAELETAVGYTVYGTENNDNLYATYANEMLYGYAGNDVLLAYAGNDILDGGTGADTLQGGEGDDVLLGGTGNDYLYGNEGNDVYKFNLGDGADFISNYASDYATTTDTVMFGPGITPFDLELVKVSTYDMRMNILGTTDSLLMSQWFNHDGNYNSEAYRVDKFVFDDGTVMTAAELETAVGYTVYGTENNDNLYATYANEMLYGYAGNDYIAADAGNDTLIGGPGNDTLVGGAGADTYLFGRTDGNDTLNETTEVSGDIDTLKLTDGIATTEPVLVKQNNDLYVFIDSGNYMRIVNEFQQTNYGIERLEVTDGHYITRSDIQNIVDTMSAINNNTGMDVMQKYNAMMADQQYQNILAQSWQQ
jgi:Ca2+-binding RTX toxin-like protein